MENKFKQQIRWGICGAGNIAAHFAKVQKLMGNNVAAIASKSIERAKKFADANGIKKYYGTYEEMAQDNEIDAVYIATNHTDHESCSIIYLSHKKPVLVEKPAAINEKQLDNMIYAAEKNHTLLMEGMWTKFLPAVNYALELIKEGKIGEVKLTEIKFCTVFEDKKSRAFQNSLGGGALLDLGVYTLNMARWILGDFMEIKSIKNITLENVDDFECITVKNANNAVGVLCSSMNINAGTDCVIFGTKGKITLPDFFGAKQLIINENNEIRTFDFPNEHGFIFEIEHFEKLIKEGKIQSEIMPLSESKKILQIMDTLRNQWNLKYSPYEK